VVNETKQWHESSPSQRGTLLLFASNALFISPRFVQIDVIPPTLVIYFTPYQLRTDELLNLGASVIVQSSRSFAIRVLQ
jgi:hypothetical protein